MVGKVVENVVVVLMRLVQVVQVRMSYMSVCLYPKVVVRDS